MVIGAYQVVQVAIGGSGELESAEADVVERFVVNAKGLVRVLHELVDGESGVVGLDDGVGDLGTGTTEKVFMMRSGYSSRILEMRSVPMPDPVPPPRE